MKKGKTAKLNGFNDAKVTYGTVDAKEFKSIYLNIQSWVTPKEDFTNWNRIVSNLHRNIKHTVHNNLNNLLFTHNIIVDLDLRISGMSYGKKSFMNLEVTLFLKKEMDFKDIELKESLRKIAKEVYIEDFKKNNYITFTPSKKGKRLLETNTD